MSLEFTITPATFETTAAAVFEVKWFNSKRGYGFLTTPLGDAIVHHSELVGQSGFRELFEGDVVTAELVETHRGLVARNVRLVSP